MSEPVRRVLAWATPAAAVALLLRLGLAYPGLLGAAAILGVALAAARLRSTRRFAAFATALVAGALGSFVVRHTHESLRGERPFVGRPAGSAAIGGAVVPGAGDGSLRFVAWGDARGGASVFERARAVIRERRPDFSIGLGDLVGMARLYQFEILKDQLAGTGVPFRVIPGNHDIDPFGSLAPYEAAFGPADWRLDVGNVTFLALDSAAGPVSDRSRATFVEAATRASAAGRRVIVFTHRPAFAPDGRTDKAMPQDDANVKAVQATLEAVHATTFSGNWHAFDRRTIGSVTQYVSGGAGSKLEYDGVHHVLEVVVDARGVRVEKLDLGPRHESPDFLDRWTTFREEATYVARARPGSALAAVFGAVTAIGALLSLAWTRRRGKAPADHRTPDA